MYILIVLSLTSSIAWPPACPPPCLSVQLPARRPVCAPTQTPLRKHSGPLSPCLATLADPMRAAQGRQDGQLSKHPTSGRPRGASFQGAAVPNKGTPQILDWGSPHLWLTNLIQYVVEVFGSQVCNLAADISSFEVALRCPPFEEPNTPIITCQL